MPSEPFLSLAINHRCNSEVAGVNAGADIAAEPGGRVKAEADG